MNQIESCYNKSELKNQKKCLNDIKKSHEWTNEKFEKKAQE